MIETSIATHIGDGDRAERIERGSIIDSEIVVMPTRVALVAARTYPCSSRVRERR